MTKKFIIVFLCLYQLSTFGQNKIITGKITDNIGQPLMGVSICQNNSNYCIYSDFDGLFHILIDKSTDIQFYYKGYKPTVISQLDTVKSVLHIVMSEDTSYKEAYPPKTLKYGFITFLQVDFISTDFTDFTPLFKDYNVDLMNKSSGILCIEIAGTYKRKYLGFNFGFADNGNYDHDSLDIQLKTIQYGLHFGYNLVNTKRILFTPKVAVKWNRYRLLNNDNDGRIPIEQYLAERDIDVRFNQMTGFIGANLSYKIYNYNLLHTHYWTFGIYGGYLFKLHDKPWIYSSHNRLKSNEKIGIENYNIGLHFSFNFDGE